MRNTVLLIALLSIFVLGCVSFSVMSSPASSCARVTQLEGTWKSYRTSSLGPAWMTLTFKCDCTARVVAQTLFMRYTEHVPYRVEDGVIIFTREVSEARWPYSFASQALVVSEAANEQHRYTRSADAPCPTAAPPN